MAYDYEDREEYEPWEKDSMKFTVGIEALQEEIFVTAIASDLASRISGKMLKKIEAHVEDTIVAALTARVDEVVNDLVSKGMQATMQPSDQFSNPKGEPITLTDFIAEKASGYLEETVGPNGGPKDTGYNDRNEKRINQLMAGVVTKEFDKEVNQGVTEIKNEIRGLMQKAAAEWLAKFQAETVTAIEGAKTLAIRSR